MPGHDLALLNSSLQSIVIQRPIALLRNILLSRPDHLDGSLNLLSDARGFANAVDLEPSPKATANIVVVDRDFGRFDPEHLRRDALRKSRDLRTHPYLASAIVHVDGAVHRLHGGVSEKRELVGRFKEHAGLERLERIAFALRRHPCSFRSGLQLLPKLSLIEPRVGTWRPLDHQGANTLNGRPHVIAHYRHKIIKDHDLPNARQRKCGRLIDLRHFTAEDRRAFQCGQLHAGKNDIDPINRLAGGLVRSVNASRRRAYEAKLAGVFEPDLGGYLQTGGLG